MVDYVLKVMKWFSFLLLFMTRVFVANWTKISNSKSTASARQPSWTQVSIVETWLESDYGWLYLDTKVMNSCHRKSFEIEGLPGTKLYMNNNVRDEPNYKQSLIFNQPPTWQTSVSHSFETLCLVSPALLTGNSF
jgi:hypothetical protein